MTMTVVTGWSHEGPGATRRRIRTPVSAIAVPLLLLLLVALLALSTPPLLFVSAAAGPCASASDCSARGVCLASAVCQCPAGWLGAQCEFGSTGAEPIFVARLSGLLGQRIVQEWRILPADAASGSESRRLHLRWTVNTDTWFGGVSGITRTRTRTPHSAIRRGLLQLLAHSLVCLAVRP